MAILTTTNQGLNFIGGTTFIQTGTTTLMAIATNGNIQFSQYGAGTLVTDVDGNITATTTPPGTGVFLPLAGGTLSSPGDLTVNGDVLLGGSAAAPKTITIQQIGVTTTDANAVMQDGNGVLKIRTLGTGAFGPTPVGAYLPIANPAFTGTLTGPTITITGDVTADQFISTNNGSGQNIRIGDDCWIGDINIANTFRVQGSQNPNNGYITFGNSSNTQLGRAGSGALTWGGNMTISGVLQTQINTDSTLVNGTGWNLNSTYLGQSIYSSGGGDNNGSTFDTARYKAAQLWGRSGTTWTDLGSVAAMLAGNNGQNYSNVTLVHNAYEEYIIFMGVSMGYTFINNTTLTHATQGNTFDLYLESKESVTNPYETGWTSITSVTSINSWPGGTSITKSFGIGGGSNDNFRLRIVPNWSSNATNYNLTLGSLQMFSSYGSPTCAYTTTWDDTNKNTIFHGNVGIGTASPVSHSQNRRTLVISDATDGANIEIWGNSGGKSILQSVNTDTYVGNLAGAGTTYILSGAGSIAMTALSGGNVGINTTGPNQKLHVNGATQLGDINAATSFGTVALKVVEGTVSTGPTLGSGAVGAQAVLYSNGQFGMYTGVNGTTGDTWMQSQRNDANTSAYNILLNPLGGNIGIGGAAQTNRKLKVHGHTLVDGTLYVSGAASGYSIEVGQSRTTEGVAYLDLTGEVGPDDYGLRMIRYGGLNAESKIIHTGTANLTINAENGGDTVFTNTNVGIGETAPGEKLEVAGNMFLSNDNSKIAINLNLGGTPTFGYADGNNGPGQLVVAGYASSSQFPGVMTLMNRDSSISANQDLGVIQFVGKDDQTNGYASSQIIGTSAGTPGTGSSGGGILRFLTTPNTSGAAMAERMRIDNLGNVTIGKTTAALGKLDVAGTLVMSVSTTARFKTFYTSGYTFINGGVSGNDIYFGAPSTYTQNIRIQGTATATNFILSSDKTLKDNIEEIDTKHIDVSWKNFELKSEPGVKRSGVIAQELEKTNPEFVRTDKEGLKSVAYIDLLITKIAELEARLEKAGI